MISGNCVHSDKPKEGTCDYCARENGTELGANLIDVGTVDDGGN